MSQDVVLDTGALIALQRDLARFRALIRRAHEGERVLRTTAPVITEFLGGSPRGLRTAGEYVSSQLEVASVDHARARRGALLMQHALDAGGRAHPGAIDALVAAEAEASAALLVFDGDRAAFAALAEASGKIEPKALSELG